MKNKQKDWHTATKPLLIVLPLIYFMDLMYYFLLFCSTWKIYSKHIWEKKSFKLALEAVVIPSLLCFLSVVNFLAEVGGYLGLFLGYSFLHISYGFSFLYNILK